jgi:glycine betaine catabolism B
MNEAHFDHITHISNDIASFWFKVTDISTFIPGQFIELYLPPTATSKAWSRRWFTVSSIPQNLPLISITTRLSHRQSSFKQELLRLRSGDKLKLLPPSGDFVLPKDPAVPVVFIALGIGVTPFLSIVHWLITVKELRHVQLISAVEKQADLIGSEYFTDYSMKWVPVVEKPSRTWHGESGKIDAERILKLTTNQVGQLYYVAGPENAVEQINNQLLAAGIAKTQLVSDFFNGYDS